MNALIAIGTNINQRDNIVAVREFLYAMFGTGVKFSKFLRTKPIGGEEGYYINGLASFQTSMSYNELRNWFKLREQDCGRNKEDSLEGYIPLDIDILEYNGKKYNRGDWNRDYIQALLKDLKEQ